MSKNISLTLVRRTFLCAAAENVLTQIKGAAAIEIGNVEYRVGAQFSDKQADLVCEHYPNTTVNMEKK
jgi:hypothetical protein